MSQKRKEKKREAWGRRWNAGSRLPADRIGLTAWKMLLHRNPPDADFNGQSTCIVSPRASRARASIKNARHAHAHHFHSCRKYTSANAESTNRAEEIGSRRRVTPSGPNDNLVSTSSILRDREIARLMSTCVPFSVSLSPSLFLSLPVCRRDE